MDFSNISNLAKAFCVYWQARRRNYKTEQGLKVLWQILTPFSWTKAVLGLISSLGLIVCSQSSARRSWASSESVAAANKDDILNYRVRVRSSGQDLEELRKDHGHVFFL